MDFRDLNYVLAIEKYQNITKAAESLYVTQPTLSKFLANLEHNLGLKLFRKLGNKYVLTYAGEKYVTAAREILLIKENLDAQLNEIHKKDIGVLNVAFPRMRCIYMLPATLPVFQTAHPNIRVNVYDGSSDENDRLLLEGKAEIAFYTRPETPNPLIDYDTLCTEEILICLCKDHPLGRFAKPLPGSKYPQLDPRVLKNERILQLMTDQRTRQITSRYFNSIGLSFENVMTTSSLHAIMELVSMGYGASFIVESHILRHRFVRPVECYSFGNPRILSEFVVAYRHGSYLPACAHDFIKIVQDLFNDIHSSPSGTENVI